MSINNHHIIRSEIFDITLNGAEKDALMLQNKVADLSQQRLITALQDVLDRCSPPDGYLFIERLEIDGGTLSIENLEEDLTQSVAQAIEKAIRELSPSFEHSSAGSLNNVQYKTAQQSLQEAFIWFLKTGSLPWTFQLPQGSTLEQILLDSWRDRTTSFLTPDFKKSLFELLTSGNVRKRLTLQFSTPILETLLSGISLEGKKNMDEILKKLYGSGLPIFDFKYFERQLWETMFAFVASGNIVREKDVISETWHTLSLSAIKQVTIENWIELHWPAATKETPEIPFSGKAEIKKAVSGYQTTSTPEYNEAKEGIYLNNAGLVLLHPFLSQFFKGLGIVSNDKLVQPDRALCLLHYLTTGQIIAPEYELILPKIICNIPLEMPMDSSIGLGEDELAEATRLLEAVIHHWQALRSTSPDALRGTFLLRPGKLAMRKDGDWLLQVESKSYDILLDHLPWSISMIKLPWMEQMLWVEWG